MPDIATQGKNALACRHGGNDGGMRCAFPPYVIWWIRLPLLP
jgi:hypothetical protein